MTIIIIGIANILLGSLIMLEICSQDYLHDVSPEDHLQHKIVDLTLAAMPTISGVLLILRQVNII